MRPPDVHKVGLLAIREDRILLCRNRRKTVLILPGGKIEPGETHLECLRREIREELGSVDVPAFEYVSTYVGRATGRNPKKIVQIELYRGDLIGNPQPHSEIGELVWFGEHDDWQRLAPTLATQILPDLILRRALPWRVRTMATG